MLHLLTLSLLLTTATPEPSQMVTINADAKFERLLPIYLQGPYGDSNATEECLKQVDILVKRETYPISFFSYSNLLPKRTPKNEDGDSYRYVCVFTVLDFDAIGKTLNRKVVLQPLPSPNPAP